VHQIRLNPITQQNVVTYDVVVAVGNPDLILMPGMTAYLSFLIEERSNALLVPNAALRFKPREPEGGQKTPGAPGKGQRGSSSGERTVYAVRGDLLTPITVQTGISDGRYTEVLAGLTVGERVVVEDKQPEQKPAGQQPSFRLRAF
jgi:HlyD family secretion protein